MSSPRRLSLFSSLSPDLLAGGDTSHNAHRDPCFKLKEQTSLPDLATCQYEESFVHPHDLELHRRYAQDETDFYPFKFKPTQSSSESLQTITTKSFSTDGSSSEIDGEEEQRIAANIRDKPQHSPEEIRDEETVKYKFNDNYLVVIQTFTNYCEDRTNLSFDGSIFFDDEFFPRSMLLTKYVPINVIAPYVERIDLQVPSTSEYCKFAPCGSTLYDYFEDYNACSNREDILRNQVIFILQSLQCPKLESLEIDSCPMDDTNSSRYPTDRLSIWNDHISSFVSRHARTLKNIQICMVRYKGLSTTNSFPNTDRNKALKGPFPKLHHLMVTLWDKSASSRESKDSGNESDGNNVWMPDWFPDSADQYWISLMKSQVHGILVKLCWVSPAKFGWDEVFQPLIDANRNTLECIHILEIEGMFNTLSKKKSQISGIINESQSSFSTSNSVLSCAAFSRLRNLQVLCLRKPNCYLTDLEKLPKCIEEFSVDDMIIKSAEITSLSSFPKLKILRLANSGPSSRYNTLQDFERMKTRKSEGYGVDKQVLKCLLHSRSLEELCVWYHCLGLDMNALKNQSDFNLASVLEKINTYLVNICKSSQRISPAEFCEWNMEQLDQDKKLVKSLEEFGFIDEECIVIHEEK